MRKVARKGATFLADVYGIWPYAAGPRRTKPDVAPELSFKDGRWFFVNFHYGKDPKYPMNESLVGVLTYPNADSTPPNRSRQGKPKTRAAVDSTAIAKQAEMKPPTDAEVSSEPGGSSLAPYEFETTAVDPSGAITARRKGFARYYVENINGVSLDMVLIPEGSFRMGSSGYTPEKPVHRVKVSRFAMGKNEVTQAQWKSVASLPRVSRDMNPDPSYFKGDNRPVEQVSWYDAMEFCARLSKATRKTYRLPSEAEWEYACRGGTTTPFSFGETITPELANYDGRGTRRVRGSAGSKRCSWHLGFPIGFVSWTSAAMSRNGASIAITQTTLALLPKASYGKEAARILGSTRRVLVCQRLLVPFHPARRQ